MTAVVTSGGDALAFGDRALDTHSGAAAAGGPSSGRAMDRASRIPEPTDTAWAVLMAAAQAGDKAAYARLLRECTPTVRRVVRRNLDGDAVEDVVQDVLLTVHRARHTYDPSRSFAAWLVTIAQRRTVDLMRRRGRRDRREVHAPFAYEAYAEAPVDHDRDRSLASLDAALADLPPRQREAVEALALKQMSLDEAAAATGSTKGALKVSFHRALRSLRGRFGASG